MIVAKANT